MLTKILLSSAWQQINLKTNYRNNNGVPVIIQSTEDAAAPTVETGLVIPAYQSFKIPADGLYYWVKMANGAVTVVYHEAGKFKVYNTGSATTDFEWLVLVNS